MQPVDRPRPAGHRYPVYQPCAPLAAGHRYYQPATGSAQSDYACFRSGNDVTAVQPQHIHLIAACGTGMGSLAGMLKARGYHVTGSDQHVYPPMSTQLQTWGIPLYNGFSAEHLVPRPELVIVGNAVSRDNAEAMATGQAEIPVMSFPQALAHFFIQEDRKS